MHPGSFIPLNEVREHAVLALSVAILLAVVSVAAFPCWSYSTRWGHGPSALAGTLLCCVAVIVVGGSRPAAPKTAEPDVEVAATLPARGADSPVRRNTEIVSIEPESTSP